MTFINIEFLNTQENINFYILKLDVDKGQNILIVRLCTYIYNHKPSGILPVKASSRSTFIDLPGFLYPLGL